jgi:hypothetical protein
MTEVRPAALALTSQAAFEWINCPLQRNYLTRQEIFTDEVLMGLAARGLEQIDYRDRNLGPTKQPAGPQPPLPGNQPACGRNYHGVKEADLGDAVGQGPEVT